MQPVTNAAMATIDFVIKLFCRGRVWIIGIHTLREIGEVRTDGELLDAETSYEDDDRSEDKASYLLFVHYHYGNLPVMAAVSALGI